MARVFLRHAHRLPRHCAGGIDRYLERLGVTRDQVTGISAPGLDSDWLRAKGGHIAKQLADMAEAEERAADVKGR